MLSPSFFPYFFQFIAPGAAQAGRIVAIAVELDDAFFRHAGPLVETVDILGQDAGQDRPRLIRGRTGAGHAVQDLQIRAGLAALDEIQRAFRVKMRGGTDAAGLRWKPLSPVTVKRKKSSTILVEFRDLITSLNPGALPLPDAVPILPRRRYQIFRLGRSEVIIGTSRPHAIDHHKGKPPKLPQRRLWADPKAWPQPWWRKIGGQVRDGVVNIIRNLLTR